jgi:hypothetical protein
VRKNAHILDGGIDFVATAAVERAYRRDEQDDVNEGADGLVEEELHKHVPPVALAFVGGVGGPFLVLVIFCLGGLFLLVLCCAWKLLLEVLLP